jgi:hypothetical protein
MTESGEDSTRPTVPRVSGVVPGLGQAIEAYWTDQAALVDPALLGLCRQRVAQITSGTDGAATETAVNAAERACLQLAEYFCYSPQSVTDEHVADVLNHLPAEQVPGHSWIVGRDASERLENFLETLEIASRPA